VRVTLTLTGRSCESASVAHGTREGVRRLSVPRIVATGGIPD